MRKLAFLLPFMVTLISEFSLAGPGSSGGGASIRCNDGKLYALDYVAEGWGHPVNSDFTKARTGDEILKLIADGLKTKIPALAASLNDFRKLADTPNMETSHRYFNSNEYEPRDLGDQELGNINWPQMECTAPKSNPEILPTFIRTTFHGGMTVYDRKEALLKELAENSPLQVSFIYVHEWLRDYTESAASIRLANRYLHSVGTLKLRDSEIRTTLASFGLRTLDLPTQSEIIQRAKYERGVRAKINQLSTSCSALPVSEEKEQCLATKIDELSNMIASAITIPQPLEALARDAQSRLVAEWTRVRSAVMEAEANRR